MDKNLALNLVKYNAIEKVMRVLAAVEDFLPQREWTIQRMREEADNLDEHNLRGNVAKVIGGSTSVAAGVTGLVLAPFTLGISAVVGSAVAAGGFVTTQGTKAVLWKLSRDTKKKVDNILYEDERAYAKLRSEWNELDTICKSVERMQQELNLNDIVHGAFWIAEKVLNFIIPIGIGKVMKRGATIVKSLYSIYTNEYFKTKIGKPFRDGNYKLLFQNLASFVRRMIYNDEFWEDVLHLSGLVFGTAITAVTATMGGVFVGISGGLAISGMNELISAIVNLARGSVSDVSKAIREKADELEQQKFELEEFLCRTHAIMYKMMYT